jgi:CubicO group peptidase (beta-lactamase class C family)
MQTTWISSFAHKALALCFCILGSQVLAQHPVFNAALRERIDSFIEGERQASGVPGIALAIVNEGSATYVRGFGHDGHGQAITADTPFPIGSLTKSFTALLVRQAIDAGQLDADAPVQRYLPWLRVADSQASTRITLRHLLNQTSGFSHADGVVPLSRWSNASTEELVRGFTTISLNRPVGERFEYSNLNSVLLGAVLQEVMGRSWQTQIQMQVFQPLKMTHSYTDHEAGRQAGMTAVHRMWFGLPVAHRVDLMPGFAPAGSLVSSASDLSRYLSMLLADGVGSGGRVVSQQSVAQLLTPATPLRRFKLGSTEFEFRYGEGWLVGSFGAATDTRWHQGALASFEAWMVMLPDTKQAVVLLINSKSDLPLNGVNVVSSRLPLGVVNLLRGQPPPQGPSLREAYRPLNMACAFVLIVLVVLAGWVAHSGQFAWAMALFVMGISIIIALQFTDMNARVLSSFAPDVALVMATALVLLCLPALFLVGVRVRRFIAHGS